MMFTSLLRTTTLLLATSLSSVLAAPAPKQIVKFYGNKGEFYTGAVATRDIIYVSGAVPVVNGTIPEGIEAQTKQAIQNIEAILEEAGTSWVNALKTTVFLADMKDYAGMNHMYGQLVGAPKPARTTVQASKLPGPYLIEMDLVAAIPRC